MGELTTFFDHLDESHKAKQISAILTDSTFSFGIWDHRSMLVKAGYYNNFSSSDVQSLINEHGDIPLKILTHSSPFILSQDFKSSADPLHYFKHVTPLKREDIKSILTENLEGTQSTFIQGIGSRQQEALNRNLESAKLFVPALFGEVSKSSTESFGVIFIDGNAITVLLKGKESEPLVNSFICRSQVDYLYYLELLRNASGLSKEELTLYHFGRIGKNSEIISLISNYYRSVKPLVLMPSLSNQDEVEDYMFQDLYLAKKCG